MLAEQICGFSGSDADNTRRAIGRKDEERLKKHFLKFLRDDAVKSQRSRVTSQSRKQKNSCRSSKTHPAICLDIIIRLDIV